MDPSNRFFRGSELPRLLILAAIMALGWGLLWQHAQRGGPQPEEPPRAGPPPEPVVPDRSEAFESVSDRSLMSFRDNAAYAYLLKKARGLSPEDLARISRRDVTLSHVWERPELYRGVPIHLLGTALRVLRFESKLSKTGWLYEAWIVTPDARTYPFNCVFEEPPEGFPIGTNVSERVVFNGFFLKIMKYQAGDVARGAPVLVGKLGWDPHLPAPAERSNQTLFWSLLILGGLFFLSLGRWAWQLFAFLSVPRTRSSSQTAPRDDLSVDELGAWVDSMADPDEGEPAHDRGP